MTSILCKNGRVWDGEKFLYADVLVKEGHVCKIEPNINEVVDFVYDATGKIVSAGLVDAHVHMKGISPDQYGIQAEMSCFPFGVTAAADAGGGYGNKALLDSFQLKNVVFVSVGFKDNRAMLHDTEQAIANYGDRVVGLKVYFDTSISEVRDVTPLQEVVDFADKHQLIVMVHSSNSPVPMKEVLGVLRKRDILTHAYHGGANNVSEDGYECIREAKKRGVIIDAGFAGYVHTDFGVFEKAMNNDAKPDVISTDITRASAYKRGGRYGMTMCMSLARTLGMSEEEIFKCVTVNPARALGKEYEWGSLRVNGTADFAVFEYTDEAFDMTDRAGNRVYDSQGYRCVLTVSDGEVVYRR